MKDIKAIAVSMLVAPIFLIGCSTSGGPINVSPWAEVDGLAALPPPMDGGFLDAARSTESLKFSGFGIEELTRNVRVGQNGSFDYPQIYPEDITPDDIMVFGGPPALRNIVRITQITPLITTPLILLERVAR